MENTSDIMDNTSAIADIPIHEDDDSHYIPIAAVYFAIVLLGIVFVTGAIGNVLTIWAVFRHKHLRRKSNSYIVNLAFTDLIVSGFLTPFSLYSMSTDEEPFWCTTVLPYICMTCTAVSILNFSAIALNRYIAITKSPSVYKKYFSDTRIAISIVIIWILGFLVALPPLVGFGRYGFDDKFGICLIPHEASNRLNYWFTFFICVVFSLPFLITTGFSYTQIMRKFYEVQKRRRQYDVSKPPASPNPSNRDVETIKERARKLDIVNRQVSTGSSIYPSSIQPDSGISTDVSTLPDSPDTELSILSQVPSENAIETVSESVDMPHGQHVDTFDIKSENDLKVPNQNSHQNLNSITSKGSIKKTKFEVNDGEIENNLKDRNENSVFSIESNMPETPTQNSIETKQPTTPKTPINTQNSLKIKTPNNPKSPSNNSLSVQPDNLKSASQTSLEKLPKLLQIPRQNSMKFLAALRKIPSKLSIDHSSDGTPNTKRRGLTKSMKAKAKKQMAMFRVAFNCVVIWLFYLLVWTPLLTLHVADYYGTVPHVYYRVLFALAYVNFSINSFIYAGLNRYFRQAYRDILSCDGCKMKRAMAEASGSASQSDGSL